MARYYVDTSIWIDYYEDRTDRFRPLGEWAFRFFRLAVERGDGIIVSDAVVRELKKRLTDEEIAGMLAIAGPRLRYRKTGYEQRREAKLLSVERDVPFGDALHVIVARDEEALVIARDHHFERLQDIAKSKKPEELL